MHMYHRLYRFDSYTIFVPASAKFIPEGRKLSRSANLDQIVPAEV